MSNFSPKQITMSINHPWNHICHLFTLSTRCQWESRLLAWQTPKPKFRTPWISLNWQSWWIMRLIFHMQRQQREWIVFPFTQVLLRIIVIHSRLPSNKEEANFHLKFNHLRKKKQNPQSKGPPPFGRLPSFAYVQLDCLIPRCLINILPIFEESSYPIGTRLNNSISSFTILIFFSNIYWHLWVVIII